MNPRRNFLKGAATTVAAPFILPSKVWSAEVSPNERIGVGMIGMGKMNGGHLGHFIGRKDAQVVGVAEVHPFRREEAKGKVDAKYGNKDCAAYNDFNELLARKDVDVVCIATPDHWHALAGIAAANAGKDIYGEKPLTHNISEALKLTAAVRKNDRVFQTGSQQRSSMEFRVAVDLVRNGVIGEVKTITTSFGDPCKPNAYPKQDMPEGLDWDRWCGPGPLVDYNEELCERGSSQRFPNWRMTREFGGGMITDWGAHHIDIAQWALGVDDTGPVEVIAPADYANAKRGAKLVYANGVVLTHDTGFGVSIYGTAGEVHVNRGQFKLVVNGETKFHHEKNKTEKTSLQREVMGAEAMFLKDAKVKVYNSKEHHDDFLQAVRNRTKPICDVAVGATTVISCHLMNMAYWHGANIKWDPQARKFISGGDDKWLTREYRPGYVVA
jgi:predicted dehydrogenase